MPAMVVPPGLAGLGDGGGQLVEAVLDRGEDVARHPPHVAVEQQVVAPDHQHRQRHRPVAGAGSEEAPPVSAVPAPAAAASVWAATRRSAVKSWAMAGPARSVTEVHDGNLLSTVVIALRWSSPSMPAETWSAT